MFDDLNDTEQLKLLCATLLTKFGGRVRVTKAEVLAIQEAKLVGDFSHIHITPANEKGDELFVVLEKEGA